MKSYVRIKIEFVTFKMRADYIRQVESMFTKCYDGSPQPIYKNPYTIKWLN